MSTSQLLPEQVRFIDDLATLLGAWRMPANAARLYGYLQLMNEPASIEEIARDLEISRSHAHAAARILESHGNARGVASRGSRRILYVCGDDPGAPLRPQVATLEQLSELIMQRGPDVATADAATRLARLAAFHRELHQAMEFVVRPGHSTTKSS